MNTKKPKISIKDNLFCHAFSSSNWFKPTYFEWDFKNVNGEILFFTDKNLKETDSYNGIKKYAWLVESPFVTHDSYEYVYNNWQKFDKIFTHSKKILNLPNSYLLPIGGCHIDEKDISYKHEKKHLVSMMYSFKRFAPGHDIRFQIAEKLSQDVHVMGSGSTGAHVPKINSCKDFAFSIVVENCKEDFYFTEKIIDCFLTGTIPIYWGCPSIDKFFNKNGFLTFETLDELAEILKNKNFLSDFFTKNKPLIIENFNIAMKYKIAEDFLWTKYNEIL
jgi:hypothetical protein